MLQCNKFFWLFVLLTLAVSGFSQTDKKKKLERDKAKLKADIRYSKKVLDEVRRNKKLSSTELIILRKKISMRQDLISAIGAELRYLNRETKEAELEIEKLRGKIQRLKEEYAKMIYYASLNQGNYDQLMFILASEDFFQAFKRLAYIQQYAQFRQSQIKKIEETQVQLAAKVLELEEQIGQKRLLLGGEKRERQILAKERKEQEQAYKSLATKEGELKQEIRKKERQQRALEAAIRKAIREALEKAKYTDTYANTPEGKALATNFINNKGKLPWPVEKGFITSKFGTHPHAVLKGITVKNNGIDISTEKGALARAAFGGEISGVIVIQGAGKAVFIRHGNYISIYSNLIETYVKSGDKVSTKETIGAIRTDANDKKTELHFEIWNGTEPVNPSKWLYKAY